MILGLSRLWRRPKREGALVWQDLGSPDAIYAIGDVHGRRDLVIALEARLEADWRACGFRDVILLYLGDVIDRGPSSAHVLDHITSPPPRAARRVMILGNHEDMFLSFLERPDAHLSWLDHGGADTLGSYGIYLTASEIKRSPRRKIQHYLQSSIPGSHITALRKAPRAALSGAWRFTHAGLDPSKDADKQTPADVTWGAMGDLTERSESSGRVVFGHFASNSIRSVGHTTCIDTGAYATGRLTALRVLPGDPEFDPKIFDICNSEGPEGS